MTSDTGPKRIAIIGHRGVGKSSLLHRFERAYQEAGKKLRSFDLDREVEFANSRSVQDIFETEGEAVFRRLERESFKKIENEISKAVEDVVLVCGAGFDPALIGDAWQVLWIRRATDEGGRIFTDRPRLDKTVDPLEESLQRFDQRNPRYAKRANEVLWLDEGIEEAGDTTEADYILDELRDLGGAITLLPEHFDHDFKAWAEKRMRWGISWFELRDDLLTVEQMRQALEFLPAERALLSFREPSREEQTAGWIDRLGLHYDWPIERGECPYGTPRYLSLHSRTGTLEEALQLFPEEVPPGTELKAALPIESLIELEAAHRWQMAKPRERILLPMSSTGRWSWYRLLRARDYSLNFLRESSGSSIDQPTLLQWARRREIQDRNFAAVIGDPIKHSRTPLEHAKFFKKIDASVYAIQIPKTEASLETLGFLRELGLRWAAVTAPLKHFAFSVCSGLSERAEELQAVNTLVFDQARGVWAGTNTDFDGLQEAVESQGKDLGSPVAVWGGGGTLDVIRKVIPRADLFSARTGKLREDSSFTKSETQGSESYSPHAVIWAVGRGQDLASPPENWNPRIVLDLNYAENSPGRDYAVKTGAKYISGLTMFRAQARVQRSFWSAAAGESNNVKKESGVK